MGWITGAKREKACRKENQKDTEGKILERKEMPKTREDPARKKKLEAREHDCLEREERRRAGQRVVYTGAMFDCVVSKKTQLATMVAEFENISRSMIKLKTCMEEMKQEIEQIQEWTERMEERMENGENYTDDEVEVLPIYNANEMMKAFTENVGALTKASRGRPVTVETLVKGQPVSISVAARENEGGTNAQAGPVHYRASRGTKADGPYLPGARGGNTGRGEAQMDCSGNKSGGKKKK